MRLIAFLILLPLSALNLTACQSTYYSAMEKVGIHKRDIMVDRLEDSQQAQKEAQKQFLSALDQFKLIVQFKGGELETLYEKLKNEQENSVEAAQNVRDKIAGVENVSTALFEEWQQELNLYTSTKLKRSSEQKLKDTKKRYGQLLTALKNSEKKMEPVLKSLQDQVLYLKHNLNARAVSALKSEFNDIKLEIENLIKNMELAIKQSQSFADSLATA